MDEEKGLIKYSTAAAERIRGKQEGTVNDPLTVEQNSISKLLAERAKTHGDYAVHARIT